MRVTDGEWWMRQSAPTHPSVRRTTSNIKEASRSAFFARRRVHRRSSIRAGPPILARPALSVQAPFLLGSRVDTAAPILARAPPRLRPPYVLDHGCNSG